MKFIGRAAFWLIDKLVYLLIGNKDFKFTPDPDADDWSPAGSMHFLHLDGRYRPARLPPNIVQYQFAPNVGEDDPMVFTLGEEIIFRLCDSRRILIKFSFDPEPSKYLRRKTAMRPVEIVTQFLHSLVPGVSIAQREDKVKVGFLAAAVLSDGCPKELFTQYDETINFLSFIDFYLFSEENTPLDPDKGLSLVDQDQYQVELYLSYGPNSLNVVFDPEKFDITEVEKVIEDVCHAHNVLLMNPPINLG